MADTANEKLPLSQYFKELKIGFIGFAGSLLLRALRASLSLKIVDQYGLLKLAETESIIVAFWHNQQLMMPWLYKEGVPKSKIRPVYVLISRSTDGRLIAAAIKRLGLSSVAGSSSRGGTDALLKLNRVLSEGSHVAITPDGPRGPALKVKSGAINLAITSEKSIIPCGLAISRCWTFASWDKMLLPKPFSRVLIYLGQKFSVPKDVAESEIQQWQEKLEMELNIATTSAQDLLKAE